MRVIELYLLPYKAVDGVTKVHIYYSKRIYSEVIYKPFVDKRKCAAFF